MTSSNSITPSLLKVTAALESATDDLETLLNSLMLGETRPVDEDLVLWTLNLATLAREVSQLIAAIQHCYLISCAV